MKTHAEHETTVALSRTQGFLVCLDCRVIVEDLPLCGAPTKRGGSCRWAVSIGSPTAEHPHTAEQQLAERTPRTKQQKPSRDPSVRTLSSTSEIHWLTRIVNEHGKIDGDTLTLNGIKRGQAEMLRSRYGGETDGNSYTDWMWHCDGPAASRLITAIRMDGRGE